MSVSMSLPAAAPAPAAVPVPVPVGLPIPIPLPTPTPLPSSLSLPSPSAITTHCFEVAFGPGSIGLHLQRTRANIGAYVDSFYRTGNLPGIAERLGRINIGDLVVSINGEDVSKYPFDSIPAKIEKSRRPVTLGFERPHADFSFVEVASDPRKMPHYLQYLMTRDDTQIEQAKLMFWLEVDQYRDQSKNIPEDDHIPQAVRIYRKFFVSSSAFGLTQVLPTDMQQRIATTFHKIQVHGTPSQGNVPREAFTEAMEWVESDVSSCCFQDYKRSQYYSRMVGSLRWSPPFVKVTLAEFLQDPKGLAYLMVYLAQTRRQSTLHCWSRISRKVSNDIFVLQGLIAQPSHSTTDEALARQKVESIVRCAMACVSVYARAAGMIGDLSCVVTLASLLPAAVLQVHQSDLILSYGPEDYKRPLSEIMLLLSKSVTSELPLQRDICGLVTADKAIEMGVQLLLLKTIMNRELSVELFPKFLGSELFEALLSELDQVRKEIRHDFAVAEANQTVLSLLPEGAVSRMLRKVPKGLSVHRGSLVNDKSIDREDFVEKDESSAPGGRRDDDVLCWLVQFDTLLGDNTHVANVVINSVQSVHKTGDAVGSSCSSVPPLVSEFLVPNQALLNKYLGCPPPAKLFNFAVATRSNVRLYASCLLLYRDLSSQPISYVPLSDMKVAATAPDRDNLSGNSHVRKLSNPFATKNVSSLTIFEEAELDFPNDSHPFFSERSQLVGADSETSGLSPRELESDGDESHGKTRIKQRVHSWHHGMKIKLSDLGNAVKEMQDTLTRHSHIKTQDPALASQSESLVKSTGLPTLCLVENSTFDEPLSPIDFVNTPSSDAAATFGVCRSTGDCNQEVTSGVGGQDEQCSNLTHDETETQIDSTNASPPQFKVCVPCGWCVMTTIPLVDTIRKPLQQLHSAMGNATECGGVVTAELLDSKGFFESLRELPEHADDFPACDYDLSIVLRSLNSRNLVTVLVAAVLEYKIILKSSKITALTVTGEFIRCLLSPLQWMHLYVPLLPKVMTSDLLQCPTPFLVGLPRDYCKVDVLPEDAVLVDLENDKVHVPSELYEALPAGRRLARALDAVCRPELLQCDAVDSKPYVYGEVHASPLFSRHMQLEVCRLCKQFIADLLSGCRECMFVCADKGQMLVILDEIMLQSYRFSRGRGSMFAPEKLFLEQFFRTQSLAHYIAHTVGARCSTVDPTTAGDSLSVNSLLGQDEEQGADQQQSKFST